MARALGISEATFRRAWYAHGLKPQLVDTFKVSRTTAGHRVLVDQKSQIQALDRTLPGLVKTWLARNKRVHMHFTPTSASWLNMIERFFRDITENRIRRGVFRSVPELISAIQDYIHHHNQ